MTVVQVSPLPPLTTLNELESADFAAALGPLFEHAPRFLARLAGARPFGSWPELFERATRIARAMPEADQLELIDSHARLGADPATLRARSELSYREQGYDEASDRASDPVIDDEFARLNEAYEARFGFRFVIFVAGRPRAELLPIISAALSADRHAEIRRAIADVVAIARDRASKLLTGEAHS